MATLGLLLRTRARMARNRIAQLREHSLFKIIVIAVFAVGFWCGLLGLFYDGFHFLFRAAPDLRPILVDVLFALFFFALTLMLAFSNGIIAFPSLFQARETDFLFAAPVAPDDLFTAKLLDAIAFSSWAFLFLGLPLIIAHGASSGVPWHFYPFALAYLAVFVFIPAALGALAALVVGRFFAHHPVRALVCLGALVLAVFGAWALLNAPAFRMQADVNERWVLNAIGKFGWTKMPLLPSFWMSKGILAAGDGRAGAATFYLLVVLANGLFLLALARAAARRWYEGAYQSYYGLSGRRRRHGRAGRLDRGLLVLLRPFPLQMRLLILKDIRNFRRDVVQWSQALIFFGLLAVYILNMRARIFHYNLFDVYWKNLVSFLNLTATCLTLSSFTSRFVFPLLSLEGRSFWVLGLMPLERRVLLRGKFYFAFLGSTLIAAGLMVLSDVMLQVPWNMMVIHLYAAVVITAGLSGLAVGLGALYPNLREDNPSKIVSGFGGTLNLVLSMIFVGTVVALLAVPTHLYAARHVLSPRAFSLWITAAVALAALIAAVTTLVPLRLGERAFERLEV